MWGVGKWAVKMCGAWMHNGCCERRWAQGNETIQCRECINLDEQVSIWNKPLQCGELEYIKMVSTGKWPITMRGVYQFDYIVMSTRWGGERTGTTYYNAGSLNPLQWIWGEEMNTWKWPITMQGAYQFDYIVMGAGWASEHTDMSHYNAESIPNSTAL